MYQISYFSDRAMTRRISASDKISDRAIESYPAPTGAEVAIARHNDGGALYGYDGQWHDTMPPEAAEAEAAEAAAQEGVRRRTEYASRPHVIQVVLRNGYLDRYDGHAIVIQMPAPEQNRSPHPWVRSMSGRIEATRTTRRLSYDELRAAAGQDDLEGRAVYSALLREADDIIARQQ